MSDLERLRDIFHARAFAEDAHGNRNGEGEELWKTQIADNMKLFAEKEKDDAEPDNNFLIPWLKQVEVLEAERTSKTTSRIVYRFPVLKEYLNPTRGFHGGAIATIFDVCTSWLLFLICDDGFWTTMGTTRSLHCTYVKPAFEGQIVLLDCEIVHAGRRLSLLKGTMKREKDGAVIATCEHNKYNVDADNGKL